MKTYKGKTISSIKIFGGKSGLAKRIIDKMSYRPIMVEGFCGGCNVSLSIDEKFSSRYCIDKNRDLINFWKILQLYPNRLYKFLLHTDYCEENFESAKKYLQDNKDEIIEPFFHSAMYFVCNRMSRGSDHKTFGWSDRLRRGMPEYISAYTSAVNNILTISKKIQNITFICDDYVEFMEDSNFYKEDCVVSYIDPPYLHATRTSCRPYGEYEMSDSQHEELLDLIIEGKNLTYLSGYISPLYDFKLKEYFKWSWEVSNSASQAKAKPKMNEILWECINYSC